MRLFWMHIQSKYKPSMNLSCLLRPKLSKRTRKKKRRKRIKSETQSDEIIEKFKKGRLAYLYSLLNFNFFTFSFFLSLWVSSYLLFWIKYFFGRTDRCMTSVDRIRKGQSTGTVVFFCRCVNIQFSAGSFKRMHLMSWNFKDERINF